MYYLSSHNREESNHMKNDYELHLFSNAMDILSNASQIKFNPFIKDTFRSSVGVEGYGNIDTFDTLAGALNYKGFRTKLGKYITGSYLKNMKRNLTKKYGEDFVVDLVDWSKVNTTTYH